MCPIVSFSNEKSTTDQKKSPLHFIPSSYFIIENNCTIGHYLVLHKQLSDNTFNWYDVKTVKPDTRSHYMYKQTFNG